MAIGTTSSKQLVLGNGATTVFNFGITMRQGADLNVLFVDAAGNETDVTVNCVVALNAVAPGAQWAVGGTVTYNPGGVPIPAGSYLVLRRIMPYTQLTQFANQGGNFPAVTEQTDDVLEMAIQQIVENLQRVPAISPGKDNSAYTLQLTPVANAAIGWDATGKVLGTIAGAGVNIVLPPAAGIAVYTGGSTFTNRTIVAGDGTLTVTNGSGVAGNPSLIVSALGVQSGNLADNSIIARKLATSAMGFSMINGTFIPSQNGTVLTLTLKTSAGADPSAADPVYILFRSDTATNGAYVLGTVTAAMSISTVVGGTFGVAANIPFNLWIVCFNDNGVLRFGFVQCLTTAANPGTGRDVTAVFSLGQFPIASSTQIGAGSTSAGVFYTSGAAVASKAYAVLGYLNYAAGLATPGTFNVNQTRCHLQKIGDPLPGQEVGNIVSTKMSAVGTGTTQLPGDDTIPQNTEGDQYMSIAPTPTNAANYFELDATVFATHSVSQVLIGLALFQDAVANSFCANGSRNAAISCSTLIRVFTLMQAGTTNQITYKARAGGNNPGTTTVNGEGGGRMYGGAGDCTFFAKEKMG